MPLTDTAIRNARPREKPVKLFDGGGARRDSARKQLAAGVDPSEARKAAKAARGGEDSLEAIAREWLAKHAPRWAPGHASKIIGRFERDIFPWLGPRPIGEITALELLEVLRRIEARGAIETAHRAHQNCGQVVRAIDPHTESDPAGLLVQIRTSFGLLVGRTAYYQVEGDRHYPNLFVLLNGGTSKGRKGTSWGRVRSVFARVPGWPRVVSGLSSGEGLKWQVRDPRYEMVKDKKSGQTREELIDEGVLTSAYWSLNRSSGASCGLWRGKAAPCRPRCVAHGTPATWPA
ncbi:MAG: hypothetical protein M3461_18845 [Pseudomonadota bacterium]|nr:hypothetical protein [Pseudomonadota bacterium]